MDPLASSTPKVRAAAALAVTVALTLLAAACGGGGGSKAASRKRPTITTLPGDPNRACHLVSPAEVEAAVGVKVVDGRGSGGTICVYNEASGPGYVQVRSDRSPQSGAIYDLKRSSAPGAQDLPGVGSKAFVAGNRALVLQGDTLTEITLNFKQPPAALSASATKMAQAVGRHV